MVHTIHRVIRFWFRGDFRLEFEFEDGVRRVVDLEPVLHGRLFGPLRDPAVFSRARLDSEVGTVVWPNDADFDPATLYEWPTVKDQFAEMAKQWAVDNDETLSAG